MIYIEYKFFIFINILLLIQKIYNNLKNNLKNL